MVKVGLELSSDSNQPPLISVGGTCQVPRLGTRARGLALPSSSGIFSHLFPVYTFSTYRSPGLKAPRSQRPHCPDGRSRPRPPRSRAPSSMRSIPQAAACPAEAQLVQFGSDVVAADEHLQDLQDTHDLGHEARDGLAAVLVDDPLELVAHERRDVACTSMTVSSATFFSATTRPPAPTPGPPPWPPRPASPTPAN